jgi:ABC-type dipeptide/oligopeptide/nickel transport system permease subunit
MVQPAAPDLAPPLPDRPASRAVGLCVPTVRSVALVILAAALVAGLAGGRWWPVATPGDPLRAHSLLEWWSGGDADRTAIADRMLPPGAHLQAGGRSWLGTDEVGRSLGLRIAAAIATSGVVAGAAALLAMLIGASWGLVAGWCGGWVDTLLMRIAEASAAVPSVVVVVVLVSALQGLGAGAICVSLALLYWQTISRMVRVQVQRLRGEAYVEASRAMGASAWHRIRVHILPGLAGVVLTYAAILLPRLIMLEGLLSFLGVSGHAATPHSFGRIIAGVMGAVTPLTRSWWPVLIPCAVMAAILVALATVLDAELERRRV